MWLIPRARGFRRRAGAQGRLSLRLTRPAARAGQATTAIPVRCARCLVHPRTSVVGRAPGKPSAAAGAVTDLRRSEHPDPYPDYADRQNLLGVNLSARSGFLKSSRYSPGCGIATQVVRGQFRDICAYGSGLHNFPKYLGRHTIFPKPSHAFQWTGKACRHLFVIRHYSKSFVESDDHVAGILHSFIAQRTQRIDTRRTKRRRQRSAHRNHYEQYRNTGEGDRIRCAGMK